MKTWINLPPCRFIFLSLPTYRLEASSARSFQRASKAQKDGIFKSEITPVLAWKIDRTTGQRSQYLISEDDGIRHGTTAETLGKIKSAFPQWGEGKTTGGNASQVTDGAAAVLLMTRRKAEELGLRVLAKHVTTTVAGISIIKLKETILTSLCRFGASHYGNRAKYSHSDGLGKGGDNKRGRGSL